MSSEQPEISVHDNTLVSYIVDCEKQEITLHTVFFDQEPHEYTEVVFSGVVAYHWEGDTFGTILFDIYERGIASIYSANGDLFLRRKNYGWPMLYDTKESLLENLQSSGVRGFIINSSIGLEGFVLAQEMRFVRRNSSGLS